MTTQQFQYRPRRTLQHGPRGGAAATAGAGRLRCRRRQAAKGAGRSFDGGRLWALNQARSVKLSDPYWDAVPQPMEKDEMARLRNDSGPW